MKQTQPETIVQCHSGYTYAERPTRLYWDDEWLDIDEVVKSWRIPGGRKFQVLTEDQQSFELFYGELYDEWRIHAL